MISTTADYLANTLLQAGVKRVYGVVGDSLNGFTDSLRRLNEIEWVHMRHEEGAVREALSHDGPALVDVVSVRQELILPPTTTIDEAQHFGMFMMKAVMDGRMAELIDLAKVNLSR